MRLIFLTQYYPPEVGAPQARLSALAAHCIRRGHAVTVLTAMPNYPRGEIYPGYGGFLHREKLDEANVIRTFIYPTQKADFLRRLTNYFSFVFSSAAVGSFSLGPADYLLVESPPLFLGLSGVWLSRIKQARLIFNVSDLWPDTAVHLGILRRDSVAYRISAWLEKFCYQRAWLVTGQSKGILANISRRFPSVPTFLLSNGVDTRVYGSRGAATEDEVCEPNGDFVALYAGLHGLAQGLDQVVAAAELLRAETRLKFVLVGDGPEKRSLIHRTEQSCLRNIDFCDALPAHEIPPLLRAADVLLVTLKTEIPGAVPSKLYEAMAAGKPVILVANGEAADIVRDHNAGIVVNPGDVNGLVHAIRTLHARPDVCRILGENGRRAVKESFDRETISSRLIGYLEGHL